MTGDGVLNGLRGEQRTERTDFLIIICWRRIEDTFQSLQLELKSVQITFDCSNLHGNRTLVLKGLCWHLAENLPINAWCVDDRERLNPGQPLGYVIPGAAEQRATSGGHHCLLQEHVLDNQRV